MRHSFPRYHLVNQRAFDCNQRAATLELWDTGGMATKNSGGVVRRRAACSLRPAPKRVALEVRERMVPAPISVGNRTTLSIAWSARRDAGVCALRSSARAAIQESWVFARSNSQGVEAFIAEELHELKVPGTRQMVAAKRERRRAQQRSRRQWMVQNDKRRGYDSLLRRRGGADRRELRGARARCFAGGRTSEAENTAV